LAPDRLGRDVTELAYLPEVSAAYVRTFTARVVALPPGAIVLDRTYFYPTGGGQPSDRGTLGPEGVDPAPFEVLDVTKSGPSVVHRIRALKSGTPPLSVDAPVVGTIDWARRHRHMRLHTGQHLLSARIFARTGRRTRKAALSGLRATLDLDGPLAPELVAGLAEDLAEAVQSPKPIRVQHVPRAEWDRDPFAARSGLVPLPPQVDPVRVVEIEGLDVCPCGGTHLRTTGEIGAVTIAPPLPLGDGASRIAFTLDEPDRPTRPG
jgi:misacylated tRNA(Ala) deacylase